MGREQRRRAEEAIKEANVLKEELGRLKQAQSVSMVICMFCEDYTRPRPQRLTIDHRLAIAHFSYDGALKGLKEMKWITSDA